jgi:hypothetical protein
MPRTVLLDPGVDLTSVEGTGVLVGGYLPHHVLGVYAAPTPLEEGEEAEEPSDPPQLYVPWMMEHYKQVLRLLPGGLHVVGFIINATSDSVASKYESKIRKLLTGIRTYDPMVEEPCLLYSKSNKTSSLIGDNTISSLDVKVHDTKLEFVQLDTQLVLDCPVALKCDENSDRMLLAHAEKGVEKLERSMSTSVCIFNNQLLQPDDLIAPAQLKETAGKKKKGKGTTSLDDTLDSEDGEMVQYQVTVLAKDDPNVPDEVMIEDNNVRLKLLGVMKSRCYVPAGTNVKTCRSYIIQDVSRSIRGRIQMHCDVLVGEEVEASLIPVIHEPPRRVFTRLPGTAGLAVCDYLYPGEGPEDSIESIREIFGFTPSEDDIEDDLEIVAAEKDVKRDLDKKENNKKFLGSQRQVFLSIGVAAISAGLAWFKFRSRAADTDEQT